MDSDYSKKLFKRLTILIISIFLLHSLATKFYWYSAIWWFDMPMHFLGGLWLGLCFIWILEKKTLSIKSILHIILSVLLVGILWELFELYFVNLIARNPFDILDTLSDIFFDLAGGFLAILYFFKYCYNNGNAVHS